MSYQHADYGLASGITFTKEEFIQPLRPNEIGGAIATHLSTSTMNPIVLTSEEDGVVLRSKQDVGNAYMTNKVDSE